MRGERNSKKRENDSKIKSNFVDMRTTNRLNLQV